ncbi:glycosyltransferase family 2 protein [Candidatus Gracilibacteria bacterium]|nr:glycosyltransferase family 2 protein [Candidatus Gracilibacteria bacterium]
MIMKTPVLFLIYNRPEYTQKVFDAIRNIKPQKIFIHADGPKAEDLEDIKLCSDTRDIVKKIDWECEVKTLFRETNLGCKLGMSGGISWFFENVEEGIILEDDCLPNKSFFIFCEKLLEKYRHEEKIMMMSGSNPATEVNISSSYFFSYFFHIWGWATWKRAWNKFDIKISDWPNFRDGDFLKSKFPKNDKNRKLIKQMFDRIYEKKSSVWGVQWTYTCLINDGFCILPKCNMISNIGFIGTHKMNNDQLLLDTNEINFEDFKYATDIKINYQIEDCLFNKSGLENLIKD